MERIYRIGELAGAVGVTVRALRHYDRIGLLKPSGHTEGGHRLYSQADLARLQQVMTLRYLGFPLDRIRELLARPEMDLAASLRIQVDIVRDRIAEMQSVELALSTLLDRLGDDAIWPSQLLEEAAAMISTREHEREEKMNRYFTKDHMRQFEELRGEIGEDSIREIEEGWRAVYREAQAILDSDAGSLEARAVLRRWDEMLEKTRASYASKAGLWEAIGNARRDGAFNNHPEERGASVYQFIERVRAASS